MQGVYLDADSTYRQIDYSIDRALKSYHKGNVAPLRTTIKIQRTKITELNRKILELQAKDGLVVPKLRRNARELRPTR